MAKKDKRTFRLTRARCKVIDPAQHAAVHVTAGNGRLGDVSLLCGVGAGSVEDIGAEEIVKDEDADAAPEALSTISSKKERREDPSTHRPLQFRLNETPLPFNRLRQSKSLFFGTIS
jgi:hypothetical protein